MGKGGSFIELLILALPLPLRKTTFIVGWVWSSFNPTYLQKFNYYSLPSGER